MYVLLSRESCYLLHLPLYYHRGRKWHPCAEITNCARVAYTHQRSCHEKPPCRRRSTGACLRLHRSIARATPHLSTAAFTRKTSTRLSQSACTRSTKDSLKRTGRSCTFTTSQRDTIRASLLGNTTQHALASNETAPCWRAAFILLSLRVILQ